MSEGVKVLDGPFAGADLGRMIAAPAVLNLQGPGVEDGYVAKYRYSAKRRGYVFKGIERVLMRVAVQARVQ